MAQPNHANYHHAYTTYDPDETPRPPRPKRFKDDKLNHIADQLVAPTDVFNQYAAPQHPQHQPPTQQHRYPTNIAYNKQQYQQQYQHQYQQQAHQFPFTSSQPSGTLPSPKAIMDKRHPSSFQQLEKVCFCLLPNDGSC